MTPTIHIVVPKESDTFQTNFLEIPFSKRGIKSNVEKKTDKKAQTSNMNLELHLDNLKPFRHFKSQYEKHGIIIGFSGPKAWIYCNSENVDMDEFKSDFQALKNFVEKEYGIESDVNSLGDPFVEWLGKIFRVINVGEHLGIVLVDGLCLPTQPTSKGFLGRVKGAYRKLILNKHVHVQVKYMYANLLFIKDYLDPFLKENHITAVKEEKMIDGNAEE